MEEICQDDEGASTAFHTGTDSKACWDGRRVLNRALRLARSSILVQKFFLGHGIIPTRQKANAATHAAEARLAWFLWRQRNLGHGVAVAGDDHLLSVFDFASRRVTQVPGSVGIWSPRWSLDGRFIAALTGSRGTILKVLDVEAQRWSELQEGGVGWFAFSRDSQYIYFASRDASDMAVLRILRIPVKGGAVELVDDLKDWRFTGAVLSWMGLDPTDAPLLMRDAGTTDICALSLRQK